MPQPHSGYGYRDNPVSDGFKVERPKLEAAWEECYRQSGWDPYTGNPTGETLERLPLDWVAHNVET